MEGLMVSLFVFRFETRGEMRETITEYGSVSTDGCAR